jgi:hypothetical protein
LRRVDIRHGRLRSLAATLIALSGAGQAASLWFLPTTPQLLATALFGAVYLLLSLGLYGVGRLSLLIAILMTTLRAWFGLFPLPLQAWEQLRLIVELSAALLCVPVLWFSLRPQYEAAVKARHRSRGVREGA